MAKGRILYYSMAITERCMNNNMFHEALLGGSEKYYKIYEKAAFRILRCDSRISIPREKAEPILCV